MITLLLMLQCAAFCEGQNLSSNRDSLVVMFWNLENFFEPLSAQASPYWTAGRFRAKCDAIAKTILEAGESEGRLPDAVGFAEVENRNVLNRLVYNTVLRKLDYGIVHYDSPDHRGIDCALLYRRSSLELTSSAPRHLFDTDGKLIPTRDILLARFGSLAILVNHHPSKLGEGAASKRAIAMDTMRHLSDSLLKSGTKGVLCIGDFNDTLWDSEEGTLKYNGIWEKIDGSFAFGNIIARERVFAPESLQEPDKTHGGMKPRRTFVGPRYTGGVSDHFPIIISIFTESENQ